ncbi:MAG: M14 family metallopeptidase [Sorangiineae bacterium]|nr:M14 family metallopeptidase [Polyangiaceae bacterium]MEB2322786.1 M14 family metallopeptidase [Sorangiineae bacterium]
MATAATEGARARAALEEALARGRGGSLRGVLERRGLGDYRDYREVLEALRGFGERGAALELIGESVEGAPLFAVVVGEASARRTTALVSGLHPMEWIGIEAHLALLERLVAAPPRDRRVVSVVVANPDGVRRVEENLRAGRRRFVRHNARGVDLNRNFPRYWDAFTPARLLPGKLFAGGSGPASEPEVRALTAYLTGSVVDRAASLHSFGGVVLYPYGALLAAAVDAGEHRRWARFVARLADPARPYRARQSSWWVPGATAPGMELDWFHDQHGALSLLVECSRGGVWGRDAKGGLGARVARLGEPFAWFNPPEPAPIARSLATALEPFARGLVLPAG